MKDIAVNNLVQMLERSARKFPDKPALYYLDKQISYKTLYEQACRLSQGLKNLGIKKGDKVAIFLTNSAEFVVSYFAILAGGAVCVPVNNMLKSHELEFIIADSGARLIIGCMAYLETIALARANCPGLSHVVITDGLAPKTYNFYSVIERSVVRERTGSFDQDTTAAILYTSGTTGTPKGAMLTHKNLLSNVESCTKSIHVTDKDNFICLLPMFHSFAFTVCILLPIYSGASIVVIEHIRPIRRVIRSVIKKKVTIFTGIPSIFNVLAHMEIPHVFTSRVLKLIDPLRLCISGAAALPKEVLAAFENKFRVPLLEGYGLTETSPVATLNPMKGKRKPGSIGLPIPGVEIKVVDDNGAEVACTAPGELLVKGDNVMKGYFNRDADTQETIKDGWLYTGDIAKRDEEGYAYIVDRKKDMINVRGLNVYPAEIEAVLLRHAKIKEAAVVGQRDKFKGEVPKAFIVVKDNETLTANETIKYLRENLASFKIPKFVEFRQSLPKTATGKVMKGQLREVHSP